MSTCAKECAAPGTTSFAVSSRAVDGHTIGDFKENSCTHTNVEDKPWWQVDLQKSFKINRVEIYNRVDCCGDRLNNLVLTVGDTVLGNISTATKNMTIPCNGIEASVIKISLPIKSSLTLCEVKLYEDYPKDYVLDLKGKPTSMYKPQHGHGAQRAVDGSNHEARSHRVNNPWWQVDMQKDFPVGEVKFINTNHHHHYHYGPRAAWSTVSIDGQPCGKIVTKSKYHVSDCGGKTGKVIKVTVNARRRGTHLFLQKVTVQPMKRLETCAGARMTGFMKIDCLGTSSCTSVPKCTVENIKGTGGKKDTYTWSKCDGQGMFIAKSDADKPIQLTCAGARSCSNNNNLLSGGLLAMGWEAHNLAPTIKCSGVHSCSDAIPGAFALKGAVPSVEEALKKKRW